MGLFDKLKKAVGKTRNLLKTDIRDLFRSGVILDDDKLEEVERALIQTDMGVQAADAVVEELREQLFGRKVQFEEVWSSVRTKLAELLKGEGDIHWDVNDPLSPLQLNSEGVTVILVAGVNGVGKTTSIAKLAHFLMKQDKKVLLAAGDTFRAAAVEQLTLWSDRLGCEIVKSSHGADPASVAYTACERALDTDVDCLIIDTAGRLQTHQNLMDELGKIYRVIQKKIPDAPHESLLVLDATTGQNGLSQAKHFSEAVQCSGIVLAKLDGTAKGGVVLAIRQSMGIPVKYIGVGEQIDDLELFNPDGFVNALFDE